MTFKICLSTHVVFRAGDALQQLLRVEGAYFFQESSSVRSGPVARVEPKVAHGSPYVLVRRESVRRRVERDETSHQSDRFLGMMVEDLQQLAGIAALDKVPNIHVSVLGVDTFRCFRDVIQTLGDTLDEDSVIAPS